MRREGPEVNRHRHLVAIGHLDLRLDVDQAEIVQISQTLMHAEQHVDVRGVTCWFTDRTRQTRASM
ncbi:MAG: hypothetical protein IPO08_17020 [Xanthomonadales bacterium]|nr:hypothetical protein [Xanthomonadales bacterium]